MSDRHIYVLNDWVVEKHPDGWYFITHNDRRDRKKWRGPYGSKASVALMVARQLRREIERRHSA